MKKEHLLKRLVEIIREHGALTATQYDRLDVPWKPSRSTLRVHFGSWTEALAAVEQELHAYQGANQNPEGNDSEIQILKRQLAELAGNFQTKKLHLHGTDHRFGVLTDTHFGSLFTDLGLLNIAYDIFANRGIQTVLHAGDILDGQKVYKGHEFEVSVTGADGQIELCAEQYPYREGITTYFINGNHDRSFWKRSGIDIGPKISTLRPDLVYLGYQEEDIVLGDEPNQAVVRLFHPEDGSAYAISYKSQRYISELSTISKPHLLVMGHYHKFEFLYYQDIFVLQAGCIQRQTPFMRGRRLAAMTGFIIVELKINEKGISSIKPEFFPGH